MGVASATGGIVKATVIVLVAALSVAVGLSLGQMRPPVTSLSKPVPATAIVCHEPDGVRDQVLVEADGVKVCVPGLGWAAW